VSYAVAVVAGYLAGSIPTGYWLVRAVKHADIRTLGSGNIGGGKVVNIGRLLSGPESRFSFRRPARV
jgi:acyl phosphate:glycerol-3-phosphate acyltransferase